MKRDRGGTLQGVGNRGGWWPWVSEAFPGAWQKNITWTRDTVLAHNAVYACITLIANDIGKLRQKLVRQEENGIWVEETRNSPFAPVLRRPNRYQNHIQFKQWWITCKLIRGNSYALKARDARGIVTALYLLDPSLVQVLVAPDGSVFYQLSQDNLTGIKEAGITVPASEIIHDRMNCLFHPLVGVSPLFASGAVANIGLKIQEDTNNFFANGSNPGGILMIPGALDPAKAKELKDQWDANYGGDNTGKIAVLADGMKFQQMRMSSVESQLIEQLKWTAEVICSTFHVPPYKIGVGTMPTYNNIEALQQDYYNTCLQSLIEEYEACMDEGLGLETKVDGIQKGVELDLRGLLRMDTATAVDVAVKKISGGIETTNEVRLAFDLAPVEGGNIIFRQQQDFPISLLASPDRQLQTGVVAPAAVPAQPTEADDDELAPEEITAAFAIELRKCLECA